MSISRYPPFGCEGQRGSTLFIVLIALVLFSALTYAISRGGEGAKNLSQEKIRLVASEIIDAGNRLSETVGRLRLRGVAETEISFEYLGGNYANPFCTTDSCKVFAFDGGGLEWETPPADVNNGEDWAYTGDIAITDVGTSAADLVMILPNLTLESCHRINVMTGIEGESDTPPTAPVMNFLVNKFAGVYKVAPKIIAHASINGNKSGCFFVSNISGTVVSAPLNNIYIFYQVLITR